MNMLDIKLIRSNPDMVKAAMKTRNMDADALIDQVLEIDVRRREITGVVEAMKAEQNADTKQIPQMKKAGRDTTELMARLRKLSDDIKECDSELSDLEEQQKNLLLSIPNIPCQDDPVGKDDSDNKEIRKWGRAERLWL